MVNPEPRIEDDDEFEEFQGDWSAAEAVVKPTKGDWKDDWEDALPEDNIVDELRAELAKSASN